jgi:hypothetical protein
MWLSLVIISGRFAKLAIDCRHKRIHLERN